MAFLDLSGGTGDDRIRVDLRVQSGGLLLDTEPVAPPAGHAGERRVSLVMPAPTLVDGRPVEWSPTEEINEEWGRTVLLIDGVDRTMFRGVENSIEEWTKSEPFGDRTCKLTFPTITPFDHIGIGGDVPWLRHGAKVEIRLIRPGGLQKILWGPGRLTTDDESCDETTSSLTMHAIGPLYQADLSVKMPNLAMNAPQDIGRVIADTMNEVKSRDYSAIARVTTGILTRQRGSGTSRLTGYIADLLATATTADGTGQWTLAQYRRSGGQIRLKDRTTVQATISAGAPGVSLRFTRDVTEGFNVIYGEGIAEDGCVWRNTKYPRSRIGTAPLFPLDPGDHFSSGGADTGFAEFAQEMRDNGYRMYSADTYDARDQAEVRDAQTRGGITVNGQVNAQTWATVFDVGANVGALTGAYYAPLAYDARTDPNSYTSQGAIKSTPNPVYEPWRMRVERFENFGEGISKAAGIASARAELARTVVASYVGTITLRLDPEEMSRWELEAGFNILVKSHRGVDRLMHIADVNANRKAGTVTLTVDEEARDLTTLAQIIKRNQDTISDPLRRRAQQPRASRQTSDQVVPWDCESGAGIIPKHALAGGTWTVLRIPAGQVGQIVGTRFTTTGDPSAIAIGVSAKPITANQLLSLVGNPLSGSRPFTPEADALKAAGLIMAWGSADEPGGYSPGALSSGDSLTGRLEDDGPWYYESQVPPWLWVCEWAADDCYIEGRLRAAPTGT